MNRRWIALLGVLLVVIAVVTAVVTRNVSDSKDAEASTSSGASTPALQGTTMQGKAFDLAETRGKPTVVNFFASWCPPCNAEATDLVAFAKAHPDVDFVGVAVNDAKADTERFVAQYELPYTVVMDPNGSIADAWGVSGIPTTFFIDKDGVQRASLVGASTRAQFEEKLQTIK